MVSPAASSVESMSMRTAPSTSVPAKVRSPIVTVTLPGATACTAITVATTVTFCPNTTEVGAVRVAVVAAALTTTLPARSLPVTSEVPA